MKKFNSSVFSYINISKYAYTEPVKSLYNLLSKYSYYRI